MARTSVAASPRPGRGAAARPADALVAFGFTGDLANKKILPALYDALSAADGGWHDLGTEAPARPCD